MVALTQVLAQHAFGSMVGDKVQISILKSPDFEHADAARVPEATALVAASGVPNRIGHLLADRSQPPLFARLGRFFPSTR